MAKNAFNRGDVVVLKSGGPPMTVDEVPNNLLQFGDDRDNYLCRWFNGAAPAKGAYAEHVLEKYVPPAKK